MNISWAVKINNLIVKLSPCPWSNLDVGLVQEQRLKGFPYSAGKGHFMGKIWAVPYLSVSVPTHVSWT